MVMIQNKVAEEILRAIFMWQPRQKRGSTFNACCPSSMKLRDWLGKDVRPKDAIKIQLTS